MFWIIAILLLIVLLPVLRLLGVILILIFFLSWVSSTDGTKTIVPEPTVMTYQELVDYPMDCAGKEQQLAELRKLQATKNFDPDPDLLNESDHAFNSRLKATIWWYAYRCEAS
jgi:hypothetical protein